MTLSFFQNQLKKILRLENVLQRFDQVNLKLHPGKCVFAQPQVNDRGFVLSEQGVAASTAKIKAVKNYPLPKNVKDYNRL